MAAIYKVRILVLGDSGVGKTSLVQLLCHDEATNNPAYTIGCSVEVTLHEYKAGTPEERTYFVELWDIGGAIQHKNSRYIFYNPVHGIILVHDLTNRKSHQNLRKWLAEVLHKGVNKDASEYDFDPESFVGSQIPILVIGTKVDLAQSLRENVLSRRSTIAEECGAGELNLDCKQKKSLAPGTTNAVKVAKFFDKVIERRVYSQDYGGQECDNPKIMSGVLPLKTLTYETEVIKHIQTRKYMTHSPTLQSQARYMKNSHCD